MVNCCSAQVTCGEVVSPRTIDPRGAVSQTSGYGEPSLIERCREKLSSAIRGIDAPLIAIAISALATNVFKFVSMSYTPFVGFDYLSEPGSNDSRRFRFIMDNENHAIVTQKSSFYLVLRLI